MSMCGTDTEFTTRLLRIRSYLIAVNCAFLADGDTQVDDGGPLAAAGISRPNFRTRSHTKEEVEGGLLGKRLQGGRSTRRPWFLLFLTEFVAFVCPIQFGQVGIRQKRQITVAAISETNESQSTKNSLRGDRPLCTIATFLINQRNQLDFAYEYSNSRSVTG